VPKKLLNSKNWKLFSVNHLVNHSPKLRKAQRKRVKNQAKRKVARHVVVVAEEKMPQNLRRLARVAAMLRVLAEVPLSVQQAQRKAKRREANLLLLKKLLLPQQLLQRFSLPDFTRSPFLKGRLCYRRIKLNKERRRRKERLESPKMRITTAMGPMVTTNMFLQKRNLLRPT